MLFRSNRERILFIVLAIIGVVLTLNIDNAIAGNCDDFDFGDHRICIGKVELSEMGHFDQNDNWVWDEAFANEFGQWGHVAQMDGSAALPDWRQFYAPYKTEAHVTDSRMDFKHFPNKPNHVRVAVMMSSSGISVPKIWRVQGPVGEQNGYFVMDMVDPPGCGPSNPGDEDIAGAAECIQQCYDDDAGCEPLTMYHDANGNWTIDCVDPESGGYCEFTPDETHTHPNSCCWLWIWTAWETVEEGPFDRNRFVEMEWVNKGITSTLDLTDEYCLYGVDYNNSSGSQEWQGINWEMCFVDHYFVFDDDANPELGVNTFILTYDTDKTIVLKYDVKNNGSMPVVPAQYTQAVTLDAGKSGKQVTTGQTVTVDNITARPLNGSLVIQWAEPDLALFPDPQADRKELRMHIGNPYDTVWNGQVSDGHSLWVSSPYQIGSVVIPPHLFEFIKDKARPYGNRLEIQFQYRFKYFHPEFFVYQNRGYGESIYIDFE